MPSSRLARIALISTSISALLLGACQSAGPAAASDISQYICPNGLTARLSVSADQSSLRLSLGGAARTLRWDERIGAYSNGHTTATVDAGFLRLQAPGLRQNCRLQIPASTGAQARHSSSGNSRDHAAATEPAPVSASPAP